MNDRFRFRAWDKSFCRMIYNIFFFWKENTITVYELHKDASKSYLPNSHIVLEQCTGLKDENGTLIYEGDIVECFYDHFDGNFTEKKVTGVVKWSVAEWSVQNEKKGDWYFLSYANYEEKHLQSDSVKVIGNIHENPELLEDK